MTTKKTAQAKVFHLIRDEDETGISGTGIVADGCVFPCGTCVLRWRQDTNVKAQSTGVYESVEHVELIHGHNGKTRMVFPSSPSHDNS